MSRHCSAYLLPIARVTVPPFPPSSCPHVVALLPCPYCHDDAKLNPRPLLSSPSHPPLPSRDGRSSASYIPIDIHHHCLHPRPHTLGSCCLALPGARPIVTHSHIVLTMYCVWNVRASARKLLGSHILRACRLPCPFLFVRAHCTCILLV